MKLEDVDLDDNLIKDLRLSFSRVSDFDRNGPKALVEREEVDAEYLDFGSLVDDMSQPGFDVHENYQIFNGVKPTASLLELCKELLKYIKTPNDYYLLNDEFILSKIKELKLWTNVKKRESILKKFTPDARRYVTEMAAAYNKTIITPSLLAEAEEYVAALKQHKHTVDFFAEPLLYQVEVIFRYKNFNFKSILDYVHVDYKKKTVRGIDLKSGSKPVSEFLSNFIKYRYYQQGAIYQKALEAYVAQTPALKGFKILPFQFLFCGRYEKTPVFLTVTEKWLRASELGFTTKVGYNYRGLNELVNDIEWHWRNDEFQLSRKVSENNGIIDINDEVINI